MPCLRLRSPHTPTALGGWVLVDALGMPRYWPTVWADVLRAGLEDSTRCRHLYAIDRLYLHFERQYGSDLLDVFLTDCQFDEIESGLTGFFSSLRNQATFDSVDNSSTWASAFNFMLDVIRHVGAWTDELRNTLEVRVLRLERLYAQLAPCKPRPPAPIRALPSIVIDDLYRVFNPLSNENPFRTEQLRWRNYLIFLLAATMGLRRSEIAILPLDAIKSDFDAATGKERYWLNVDESPYEQEDSRFDAPSLKNSQSRRQLPVSQDVLIANDNLSMGHRRTRTHSYLFGSQKGKPISLRSIQRIFEVASEHLSATAKKALLNRGSQFISAHDLRHTCAVYRLTKFMESGIDLDTATNKLRVFFGWSATSAMPRHYARAYFESESADVWTDSYDTFVSALREIDGGR